MKRVIIPFLALILFVGCSPTKPGDPSVTGQWKGSSTVYTISTNLVLNQDGEQITGSGVVSGTYNYNGAPRDFTNNVKVTGNCAYPGVSLSLSYNSGGSNYNYSYVGTFKNEKTISGQLDQYAITLTKQ